MFSGDSRLVLNSMRTVVVSIYHTVPTFCVIRMRTEPILCGDRIGPYSSPSLDHDNVVEAALGGAENRRRQATSDQRGGPHCLLSKTGTRQEQAKDSKQASKRASKSQDKPSCSVGDIPVGGFYWYLLRPQASLVGTAADDRLLYAWPRHGPYWY